MESALIPEPGHLVPHVYNRIDAVREWDDADRPQRRQDHQQRLVVHRCSLGPEAADIARAYCTDPSLAAVSRRQMPYTFVIRRCGMMEQALRALDVTPHGVAFGFPGIGVALIGDFRTEAPTSLQWHSLLVLCHVFSGWLKGAESIMGHDGFPVSREEHVVDCPGQYLDIRRLWDEVQRANLARVKCCGVAF
jgi:hypothetical protein